MKIGRNSGNEIYMICGLLISQIFACSNDETNTTPSETVTDIDGNVYQVITIGQQVWMSENLRVTRFRNGDIIGTTSKSDQDFESEIDPRYQWSYQNIEGNAKKYGRLYTWYTIMDARGICPEGWHIPTDEEWTELTDFLGGESNAQQKLIDKGFKPQYGGSCFGSNFIDLDSYGHSWSSSSVEISVPGALDQIYVRTIVKDASNVYRDYRYKKSGLSLRCVKD